MEILLKYSPIRLYFSFNLRDSSKIQLSSFFDVNKESRGILLFFLNTFFGDY